MTACKIISQKYFVNSAGGSCWVWTASTKKQMHFIM